MSSDPNNPDRSDDATVSSPRAPLTYRDAGVDIERGDRLVQTIKGLAAATHRPGVLAGIGGFGALFEVPVDRYRRPVLVSGTDGVGTKLKLAIATGRHRCVGVDLVAMSVNDVLTLGAEPLYFLDYLATARLDDRVAAEVIGGIADACAESGAALIGGETAEMPGMYAPGDYDLAGFCVGVVERDRIIDGSAVRAGDVLLGLASSGPHSNGYSLIRRVLEREAVDLDSERLDGRPLVEHLMAPTRLYARGVMALCNGVQVKALAHITGGGITENLPRVLPEGLGARIDTGSWQVPTVFEWLAECGAIDRAEMLRTFNMGVGMIACVAAEDQETALSLLIGAGEQAWPLGVVEALDSESKPTSQNPAPRVRYSG